MWRDQDGCLFRPFNAMNNERDRRSSAFIGGFKVQRAGWLLACAFAGATAFAGELSVQSFDLDVSRGAVPAGQRVLLVHKGDPVRLRVAVDEAGELHVHGYRLEAKAAPGKPAQLEFKAHATGRFRLEWHRAADKGKAGDHHGPPLASLEVRPR